MNKMTLIGLIGLMLLACQSTPKGYKIKGNIEGAGNGIAILLQPIGFEEATTEDTVKMENGFFHFHRRIERTFYNCDPNLPRQRKTSLF